MKPLRPVLLALLLLALGAVPAHATLLVRSDGAGLFINDQNGRDDAASLTFENSRYRIQNFSSFDFIKFDVRTGCSTDGSNVARCDRNGPVMNVQLAGGNDEFSLAGSPAGVSSVAGSSGNDDLTGHNAGRDNLNGGTGEDELKGLGGNDGLAGREDSDSLFGAAGNDTLQGDGGFDSLYGGAGVDSLTGGSGNDFFDAKEPVGTTAERDTIGCGDGSDRVEADLQDVFVLVGECENRSISAVGETPLVRIGRGTLRVRPSGRVRVRLRCPGGVGSLGCKGRLSLRLDRRGAGRARKRYEIRAGRSKTVTVRLSRGSVRTLRARQRRGRRTRAILASVERGRKGRKTIVRNPGLRLR
jgi:hypothetical protein